MIGKTILHYYIVEKLGEGDMGVVYKAEDTKLDRTVAIKFLPKHIAGNLEEQERFVIEAKAAAALNHPNIATIHAIEESDDETWFLIAQNYALLDDTDGCAKALRKTIELGFFNYPFMLKDSFLDPVRGYSGFQHVLALAKEKHEAFKMKYFPEK